MTVLRIYWFLAGVITALVVCNYAKADIKAAVIDSGFLVQATPYTKLCSSGHYDFVHKRNGIYQAHHPHGTYVTLSATQMINPEKKFCFVIMRVMPDKNASKNIVMAIQKSIDLGVDAINISLEHRNYKSAELERVLKKAFSKRIHVFIAAGNANLNLNDECRSYPTCLYPLRNKYKHVVGAVDYYGNRAFYSNYGSMLTEWFPGDFNRVRGTSFASPRAMGHFLEQKR